MSYFFGFICNIIYDHGCANESNFMNASEESKQVYEQELDIQNSGILMKLCADCEGGGGGSGSTTFHLTSLGNNAWFELGQKFKWTKLTPHSGYTFYRYNATITGNGQEYHRYAAPYDDNTKTSVKIDGIAQGSFSWKVKAEYKYGALGPSSEETWTAKIYDARIKGPSSAIPRNGQTSYVNERSGWGPYSYTWKVYNKLGQLGLWSVFYFHFIYKPDPFSRYWIICN